MAFGRRDEFSTKQVAAIVVVVIAVVALTLGLGLGLGLRDKKSSEIKTESCFNGLQKNTTVNYDDQIPWDQSCPTPNAPSCPAGIAQPLVLVSMDGFRADYLRRGHTPTLSRLGQCGVTTPYMRAMVPTKTFPNHYSIVTGLYPESHGIVANSMYDLDSEDYFRPGSPSSFEEKWWQGEPIWNTAKNHGKTSLTMYWPGSEAPVQGIRPDYCYNYDESVPFKDRVNEIMGYFTGDPSMYPAVTTFYMHEPDSHGHGGGPYSKQLPDLLGHVDSIMQLLLSGFQQKGLDNCVNIMVVSDHGMEMIDCDRTVSLAPYYGDLLTDLYVHEEEMVRITSQYVWRDGQIVPQEGGASPQEILDKVTCQHYNDTKDWYVTFQTKEDLPKRYHYASHPRIEEVIGDVEKQYLVYRDASQESNCYGGAHGYDNIYDSMHGIFIGYGPGFKSNFQTDPFENIELYNIMAELLQLDNPAPNNGTKGSLHNILSTPAPLPDPGLPLGSYGNCSYPTDPVEEATRRNVTASCNWQDVANFTQTPISDLDGQLRLSASEVTTSEQTHVPLGRPLLDFTDAAVCQLTQRDYILGYSSEHRMPLWAAYRLRDNPSCSMLDPDCSRSRPKRPDLIRPDVRLSTNQQTECNQYTNSTENIYGEFLFPPGFISETNPDAPFDGHIATNVVPMYQGFRQGVWQVMLDLLEEYAEKYGDLQVITGPLFDYNYDGSRDDIADITHYVGGGAVPVPTHYYVSASYCADSGAPDPLTCVDSTQLLSVILPHKQHPGNCWERRYHDYIHKNVARVRDIELLSDLHMLSAVTTETTRVAMTTHLAENLWERLSWADLRTSDTDGCPPLTRPAQCPHSGYAPSRPPVMLISIDGLRPDYLDRGLTPTLQRLKDCGTSARYMSSIYPTMTFPNHYTITSGLYPESHGIVDNNMYDMDLDQAFWLGSPNSMNTEWWKGEPLWNRVENNNKTAVAFFWPGSDVAIDGIRPTRYMPYNGAIPYSVRVNTTLNWLSEGTDGTYPDFILLYFSKVDEAGHEGGPDSLMVSEALIEVEQSLKQLMDGLYRQGLHQCINIIITSDHGMTDMSCDRNVVLNDYIDMNKLQDVTYTYQGSSGRLSNKYYRVGNDYFDVATDDIVPKEEVIAGLNCKTSNMDVFDKIDLPKRHHYVKDSRIDDIVFVMRESWLVQRFSPWCGIDGQHGWDERLESMRAYFSAFGPDFKDKSEVEPFENIELYNIMCHLLDIEAGPNNGTEGSLYDILHTPPALPPAPSSEPYNDCLYPANDAEYESRANLTTVGCSCIPPAGVTIKQADELLDHTPQDKMTLETLHVPYGIPYVYGGPLCTLHHDKYVAGYDAQLKMAAWSAYTITDGQGTTDPQPSCLRPDVRLEQTNQASCDIYQGAAPNMTEAYLFSPAWSDSALGQMDALILSNTVPMYETFRSGIWQSLLQRIEQWATVHNTIHVIQGPVFDHDGDGRRDANITWYISGRVPVPSHYYTIVLRCPTADCTATMDYEPLAFVLPHKQSLTNCMTHDAFLLDNTVRIRDIELLTDMEFLTEARTLEGIKARTFISTELWDVV